MVKTFKKLLVQPARVSVSGAVTVLLSHCLGLPASGIMRIFATDWRPRNEHSL